jgi:phosphate transport system protein
MHLDKELEHLNLMLLKMADVVQKNIIDAFAFYSNSDNEAIEINDDIIDQYEHLIDEICLDIIIKERPVAKDLRIVSGIMKLISDLERIGDHAQDVHGFTNKLAKVEKVKIPAIEEMLETSISMVNDAILSFIKEDLALARDVIKRDDIVDSAYLSTIDYLIENNSKGKLSGSFTVNTTLVIKYIERIADHAVNIAEWVVYIISGIHKDKKIF